MEAADVLDAAEEVEEIAESLKAIQKAALQLQASGLTHETLVLLVRHKAQVNKADVENVLWALTHLDDYLEDPKTAKKKQLSMT
jgi:hypothetical protein